MKRRAERGVVGVRRGDHLHRDGPLEIDVDRAVDDAHAAAAGNAFDPLAGDHASDEALVGHGVMVRQPDRRFSGKPNAAV